jgi:hypothetical protein
MFDSLWNWIRHRTKNAVLSGFADALGTLDGNGEDGTDAAVAALTARLKALPGPKPEEATADRRKKT